MEGVEIIKYKLGSSKAGRISRALKAQATISHYQTPAQAQGKLPKTAHHPKSQARSSSTKKIYNLKAGAQFAQKPAGMIAQIAINLAA